MHETFFKGYITRLKEFWNRNRVAFVATLIAGALIHFMIYSEGLMNPDAVWLGEEYIAGWEVSLGRWGLELFDRIHAGLNAPLITTAVALFWFALGGVLINELFAVESKVLRVLSPMLFIASPLVAITITYYYCSDAYAFSFFLAVAAVVIVGKYSCWGVHILPAAICIMFSLSIYQSNLGVTAGLSILIVIFRTLYSHDKRKENVGLLLRLLTMEGLGTAVYYGILKIVLRVKGLSMSAYKGAENVGLGNMFANLGSSIQNAYSDFWQFFTQNTIMVNGYLVRFCYGVLFVLIVAVVLYKLVAFRIGDMDAAIIFVGFALLPLACNVVDIAVPDTRIILLTSGGLTILPAAMLAMINVHPSEQGKASVIAGIRCVSGVLATLLIINFAMIINADALVMKEERDKTVALANRIYARIEENENFLSGCQVLISGTAANGNYPIITELEDNVNHYAKYGLVWKTYNGSLNCWRQVYRRYLGVELNWCTEMQFREIAATPEFQSMTNYPAEDSIRMINGVLVIKVSPIEG